MSANGDCPACHNSEESLNHILRECRVAQEVWKEVFGSGTTSF